MECKTIINGQVSEVIDVNDRGLNYGDGFFTTAKVKDGEILLWPYHLARLEECRLRLGFSALDFEVLENQVRELVRGVQSAVLKIIITRGNGGRGYAPPADEVQLIVCRLLPLPADYLTLPDRGLSLGVAKMRLAQQPLLAGLKTLNRLEQVLLKQEAQRSDYDDLVVLDSALEVIETSSANLVGYKQGHWFTPRLDNAGVEGVCLRALCDKLDIHIQTLSLAQLLEMEQIYCCNSLMGIVPVIRLNHKHYNLDIAQSLAREAGLYL